MGRVYKRGDVWWINYWHRGKEYWESTGIRGASRDENKQEATKILMAKIGEISQGTFAAEAKITVGQIIDDFEQDYQLRGGRAFGKLHSHLKPVREAFGHLKAQDLTERRIDQYIKKRIDQGFSAGTVNREMQPLGQALRLAHTRQLIRRVPTIRKLPERNVRQGFFEAHEIEAVLNSSPRLSARPGMVCLFLWLENG